MLLHLWFYGPSASTPLSLTSSTINKISIFNIAKINNVSIKNINTVSGV